MNTAELSLDRAPPLHIPLRFFLSAPLFLIAAGLLLLFQGEAIMQGRWQPATLALAHLISLGVITMVMFGALSQMLPVIAGSPLPSIRRIGPLTHLLLFIGTALLASGFISGTPSLLLAGAAALVPAILLFIAAAGIALLRVASHTASTRGMGLSIAALAITGILGVLLVFMLSGHSITGSTTLTTTIHHAWGLGGWMGILIVAVSWQIVPMFYVTPEYPALVRRTLTSALMVLLVVYSSLIWLGNMLAAKWTIVLVLALFGAIGLITMRLFGKRRRKTNDPTLYFWRTAIASLLLLLLLEGSAPFAQPLAPSARELIAGGLLLFGVILSIVCGMLIKITPFLCWFHLHNRQLALLNFDHGLPSMKELLPDRWAFVIFTFHLLTLLSLLASPLLDAYQQLAGLPLLIQGTLLGAALSRVAHRSRIEWLRLEPSTDSS